MKHLNKFIFTATSIALLSTQITACGGGGETSDSYDEPVKISASNWQNTQAKLSSTSTIKVELLSRPTGDPRVSSNWHKYLKIEMSEKDPNAKQTQFLIDIDNNPKTGYQFENEAWSHKSGVDYLVENGLLYKSTANDSSWSWKFIKAVNGRGIQLDAGHDFEPLCNDFNVGYIQFDNDWNVDDFYPKTNSMSKQSVAYCENYNAAPEITMLGTKNMIVELNDPLYADPGATAHDTEDGDISSQIQITSTVDISKVGNYTIIYKVTDSQGVTSEATRKVNVVIPNQGGITIDGKSDDWTTINPLVNEIKVNHSGPYTTRYGYLLKATNTNDKLYFYAQAWVQHPSPAPASASGPRIRNNWQIYIDSDNNPATGYDSFDYLIENGILYKFSGSYSLHWAWEELDSGVNFARGFRVNRPKRGSVEVALTKSVISNWSEKINIRFTALTDNDWSTFITMPLTGSSVPYTLK